MADTVTCKRHPSVETRLFCAECGDPICPRCAVPTPVGQKCPDDARLPRTAYVRAKPPQLLKGLGLGLVVAAAAGFALSLIFREVGYFTWLTSGLAGYAVGRTVRFGAENNHATVFRGAAITLAVVAVAVGWVVAYRSLDGLIPSGLGVITYLAAAYGAFAAYR